MRRHANSKDLIPGLPGLFLLFCASILVSAAAHADEGTRFQLRAVSDTKSDKTVSMRDGNGKEYFLHKEVLATEADVENASSFEDASFYGKGNYAVQVTFKKTFAKKLAEITEKNLFESLALIADGRLLTTARIMEVSKSGIITIPCCHTKDKAAAIVAQINAALRKPVSTPKTPVAAPER